MVTITTSKNGKTSTDFIVAYPQDVILEQGKVSDYDSDVIYWNVFYSKKQIEDIIKSEEEEKKTAKAENREAFTTWDIAELKDLMESKGEEERHSEDTPKGLQNKSVTKSGIKITFVFNRGVGYKFIP